MARTIARGVAPGYIILPRWGLKTKPQRGVLLKPGATPLELISYRACH